jgi:hypothetical protein
MTVSIVSTSIYQNSAKKDGGAISIMKSNTFISVAASTILIDKCTNINKNFAKWGSFVNSNNNMVSLTVSNSMLT